MRKEVIKVPVWLDKSAASVLEQTFTQEEQDQNISLAEGSVVRSQLSHSPQHQPIEDKLVVKTSLGIHLPYPASTGRRGRGGRKEEYWERR